MIELERMDPRVLAWIVAVLALGAVVFWSYRRLRRIAERRALLAALKDASYDVIHDVLIPDGMDGRLHLDFLLLTQRGILVLDLREVPGMVFGGDQMNEWAVMTRRRRYSFSNPQGPLLDRVAAVRQMAGDTPVEGRVLFTARARFPKGRPKSVLMLDSLKLEYAPVDKGAMQSIVARFRPGWESVKSCLTPSDLARR
ncbi:MAG TPA: nuclease-related domain-containing protein [Steroidobacteraceae bacterium]|nr:nuclease-related domain-containing protein [Steroidobacteraceae bacterium]